ncbi:unnamed protein product [Discosporangium mesarthrocarpum]
MEAFLVFLFRLRYPNRLDDVSIRMGRKYTQMRRVVKDMVDILVKMFGHMPTDGIGVWATHFDRGTSVIRPKAVVEEICCFVDGTLRPHCK